MFSISFLLHFTKSNKICGKVITTWRCSTRSIFSFMRAAHLSVSHQLHDGHKRFLQFPHLSTIVTGVCVYSQSGCTAHTNSIHRSCTIRGWCTPPDAVRTRLTSGWKSPPSDMCFFRNYTFLCNLSNQSFTTIIIFIFVYLLVSSCILVVLFALNASYNPPIFYWDANKTTPVHKLSVNPNL